MMNILKLITFKFKHENITIKNKNFHKIKILKFK